MTEKVEGNAAMEARCYIADFKDGRMGHESRKVSGLSAWKMQGDVFSL